MHSQHTVHLLSALKQSRMTWTLACLTGVFLVVSIVYSCAVSFKSGSLLRLVPNRISASLLVLRFLTEATGFLLLALLASVLEIGMWAIAMSSEGTTVGTLLGLSPATASSGLLLLLGWKKLPGGGDYHRICAVLRSHTSNWTALIARLLAIFLIPVMNVIITSKITDTIIIVHRLLTF
jgi:hypothetical protein